jgi:iron only hydrogenase large subunit-like protein
MGTADVCGPVDFHFQELEPSEFDNPLGTGSGGGVLFGTTGGVMEAALRTVYELVSGQPMVGAGSQGLRDAELFGPR